ncbi:uncharacterized acetyltransferase At3g50280-like [Prosopis cineraria]|uniref:uncharacterized acetyltransferase At3g50280-like n=1 Tax=Prosopis cineraria TaxID=364024 RepID=UPI0024108BD1|nr:uncharacterized acetyltransferase At3g50280-like [Prosopis cineraria]
MSVSSAVGSTNDIRMLKLAIAEKHSNPPIAAIQVISTTMVQARSLVYNGDSLNRIVLNPWELRFIILDTLRNLFLAPSTSSCRSLAVLLYIVPDAHDGGTSSVFVTGNNAGASFVHAIAENTTMADILEPTYVPPIIKSFFPLGKSKSFEATHIPLMTVQVTELVDGIFIACLMNHCLVEVKPYWNFLNTWAKISQDGLNHLGSDLKLASFER